MITPALPLAFEAPRPRYTVQADWLSRFAILDGNEAVAWAVTEALAKRLADFLNWRTAMDSVERRYSEALQLDAHSHG